MIRRSWVEGTHWSQVVDMYSTVTVASRFQICSQIMKAGTGLFTWRHAQRLRLKVEPASVFTPGNNTYATTFASTTPNALISNSGVVMSSLQLVYLLISLDKHVNSNGLDRSKHGRLCLAAVDQ